MCGITGFIGQKEFIRFDLLERMGESLTHRGPDQFGNIVLDREGELVSERGEGVVGLAHRRLSIIDLSEAGRQPMSNEDESIWIVFNGECYNYQALKLELETNGHIFSSDSDTEVLIHGYEQWGMEKLVQKLNGMFSFVLWDRSEKRAVLARDRVGKKPLYYTITANKSLVFASEIKALIVGGFVDQENIDPAALAEFWLYGYTTGERTVFRQVKRILPGHYTVFSNGKLHTTEYWDCVFEEEETTNRSIDDYCDELYELLQDSIRLRLISDVPVGVFLSGGIDSSLITAITSQSSGEQVGSFSIGFNNVAFDESAVAREIAGYLGIGNERLLVNEEFAQYFKLVATHFDELFGDSSSIPTFFVCREARKHVTVVLTGDAGDELFAGYDSYAKALSLWGSFKQKWLMRNRTSLLQTLVDWAQLGLKKGNDRYSALEAFMPQKHLSRIVDSDWLQHVDIEEVLKERVKWYHRVEGADVLSALQYINMKTYLPDDILVKVDRMSMFHALECRNPFLDYRIIEFASKLPFSAKIGPNGERKYLLRVLLSRFLPQSIIERPKMGFSVPWSDWCKGSMRQSIKRQWQECHAPFLNNEAAEYLFPTKKPGWPSRQWNAYCTLAFYEKITGKGY